MDGGNGDLFEGNVDLAGVYSANVGNASGYNNAEVLFNPSPQGWRGRVTHGGAAAYGVCYGRKATKLPTTVQVLNVCKTHGISKMVLPSIDEGGIPILDAVANDKNLRSKMKFSLWIGYNDLAPLANDLCAKQWVRKYVEGHESIVSDICVGDVTGNGSFNLSIFKNAMQNLKHIIPDKASIKLSAVVSLSILEGSYQAETAPSKCKLTGDARNLLGFLYRLNCGQFPLFVCIMPYFMMTDSVKLDNCLLKDDDSVEPFMWDGHYSYSQAFDAMLDSIWCALNKESSEQLRKVDLHVVSGWPTDGPEIEASRESAKIYIRNFVKRARARKCTPRNNKPATIFIYSLVDEDMIDTAVEEFKHLGAQPYLP